MFILLDKNKKAIEINKSYFIAIIMPFNDVNNFKNILELIKKEYPKATHYLYAYKVGNISKSNDDKEPGNIAHGFLKIIDNKHLDKVLVVVIRYFGGTKLGASNLTRTYLNLVNEVINTAFMKEEKKVYRYHLEVDYPTFNRLKSLGYHIENVQFFDKIRLVILATNKLDNELKVLKITNYQAQESFEVIDA